MRMLPETLPKPYWSQDKQYPLFSTYSLNWSFHHRRLSDTYQHHLCCSSRPISSQQTPHPLKRQSSTNSYGVLEKKKKNKNITTPCTLCHPSLSLLESLQSVLTALQPCQLSHHMPGINKTAPMQLHTDLRLLLFVPSVFHNFQQTEWNPNEVFNLCLCGVKLRIGHILTAWNLISCYQKVTEAGGKK